MNMNSEKFKQEWEKPIHKSLDVVFDRADLSSEERDIYLKYRKECEYWLLRSKLDYSQNPWSDRPNFIKLLSHMLINLQHENVHGPKDHLVKELFSDKSVHRFIETRNGIRSTKNSGKIGNTYFELDIMSFFLSHGFQVELPNQKINGTKIPEFKVSNENIDINIEAKKMDVDNILDSIFGDHMTLGIDYRITPEGRDRGYKRIESQFINCYEKAFNKLQDIPSKEYYLIFILAYYEIGFMGKYTVNFINDLQNSWENKKQTNFIGVVLPQNEKTYMILNPDCDKIVYEELQKLPLEQYNNYIPEIIRQ